MVNSDILHAKEVLSRQRLQASVLGQYLGLQPTRALVSAAETAGSNVHAVGIGYKIVNGKCTDILSVRTFVSKKFPKSEIAKKHRIPDNIDGIPTDVVEAPLAFLGSGFPVDLTPCSSTRKQRQRPVVASVGAGLKTNTVGTIGYFCRSTRPEDDPSAIYVLSNNHVFADLNKGQVGDPIIQPSSLDGGTDADTIAKLKRWVGLHLDGKTPNFIDAAIGELSEDIPYRLECCSIGALTGSEQAIMGMDIRKYGRTSGYAEGVVTDISIDALIGLDPNDFSRVALFHNQIRVAPSFPSYVFIGLNGDSGSLVVKRDSLKAVGLFFACASTGSYGYANNISEVLSLLQIELAT